MKKYLSRAVAALLAATLAISSTAAVYAEEEIVSQSGVAEVSEQAETSQMESDTEIVTENVTEASESEQPTSGTCGESLTWAIDEQGTLTISGTGEMTDFDKENLNRPWEGSVDSIINVVIEDEVTSIGNYAFMNCINLTSIKFTDNTKVNNIGKGAFYACAKLEEMEIPKEVTVIQEETFTGCEKLKKVTVPVSVTEIQKSAFTGCLEFESVDYAGNEEQWNAITIGEENDELSCAVVNYAELVSATQSENIEKVESGSGTDGAVQDKSTRETINDDVMQAESIISESSTAQSTTANSAEDGTEEIEMADDITTGSCGKDSTDKLTWTLEDDKLTISGKGDMADYVSISMPWYSAISTIKEVVIEDGVTSIGDCAFFGCIGLTSITIPDSVFTIGEYTFWKCTNLVSISFPENLYEIGSYAFYNCSSLENLNLTNIQSPWLSIDLDIGDYAFGECEKLTYVNIEGEGNCRIQDDAFLYCKNLKTVTCKGEMYHICHGAFYGCTSLESVNIADGVPIIGDAAFFGCCSLININTVSGVALGLLDNGDSVFQGCLSLKEITIVEGEINEYDFYGCSSLESITINEGVAGIGEYAFYGCSSLTEVKIPVGVTSIAKYAFYKCTGLTNIEIPKGVTSIGAYAFYQCSGLTSIEIPKGVTSIGDYAFYQCSGLTSIEIPEGITSIGADAFVGCKSLTSIEIPEGVTSIGTYAFASCSGLSDIYLPDSLNEIGSGAFRYCSGLISIEIPVYVTNLGDYTFEECSSLTSVTFKNDTVSLDTYVFENCSNLKKIVISGGFTEIGRYAFRGCSSLEGISLKNGIECIEEYTFNGCGSLTKINVPESVTSIGQSAFRGCSSLKVVDLPEGLTSIGSYAFYQCSNLTSINIPEGVSEISDYSFYECINLENMIIPDGVTSIKECAFYGCSNLESVTISKDVAKIWYNAFTNCSNLTIYCYKNSYVESYAIEKKIPYVIVLQLDDSTYNITKQVIATHYISGYGSSTTSSGDKVKLTDNQTDIKQTYVSFGKALENYLKVFQKDVTAQVNTSDNNIYEITYEDDQERNQPIITLAGNENKKRVNAAYEGLSKFINYVRENNATISKINLSDSTTLIETKIMKEIRKMILPYNTTFKSSAGYTVQVNIQPGGSAFTGSISVSGGNDFLINSSADDASETMANYLKNLNNVAEDVAKQGLMSYMNTFLEITYITEQTQDLFVDTASKISDYMTKKGFGKIQKYASALYVGYKRVKGITDNQSLLTQLEDSMSLYDEIKKMDFSDSSINDAATKEALSEVEKYRAKLENQLYNYIYHPDEDLDTDRGKLEKLYDVVKYKVNTAVDTLKNWKKLWFNCPVSLIVYDENGNEIGRASDGYCEYTDDIYINVCGDSKELCIPGDMNVTIQMIGTDDGSMNYSVEEFIGTTATGRQNYYNIPLAEGTIYSQTVLGDSLGSDGSDLIYNADNEAVSSDEYIAVTDNALCNISADMTEGGYVDGIGTYAKGDGVLLNAAPEDGYVFGGWYDENGSLVELSTFYHFTATADTKVYAVFKPAKQTQTITCETSYELNTESESFNLNASTDGNGQITYYADNEEVVQVSDDGQVEVKGEGEAIIYLIAAETGSYEKAEAEIKIEVYSVGEFLSPRITLQPENETCMLGKKAVFQLIAKNATAYQWQYSKNEGITWSNLKDSTTGTSFIDGTTTDKMTLLTTNTRCGYLYRCQVTGVNGDVTTSDVVELIKDTEVRITTQPKDTVGSLMKKTTFKVTADNAVAYQWQYSKNEGSTWNNLKDSEASSTYLGGATTKTVTMLMNATRSSFLYRCKITGEDGNVIYTDAAKVLLFTITAQPESVEAKSGDTVTFSVGADYAASYQWYYQKEGSTSWYKLTDNAKTSMLINGSTADTMTIKMTKTRMTYKYRCKVKGQDGTSKNSEAAEVEVTPEVVETGQCGDSVTYTVDSNGTLTILGSGAMWDYGIPLSTKTQTTDHEHGANPPWRWNASINKLVVSEGITYIGDGAFACLGIDNSNGFITSTVNLGNFTVPSSVTQIGAGAFYGCTFNEFTIPQNVNSYDSLTTSYGEYVFGLAKIENFYVDSAIVPKMTDAYVENVYLSENVSEIRDRNFYESRVTNIYMTDNVTSIGTEAFAWSKYLKFVQMPKNASIGHYAFEKCVELEEIEIPEGCSVGYGLFYGDTSLRKASIECNVENSYQMFRDCSSLEKVKLKFLDFIGSYTFCDCNSLTSIEIPKEVTNIYEFAFNGCESLADVYYEGTEEEWSEIEVSNSNDPLSSAVIHYNSSDIE